MPDAPNPPISARRKPKQDRSNELVRAVLQAAAQVLASEGAQRFTTARVAERAGVSIGSLYQYFPNKAAILFRLQTDEWRDTRELLRSILEYPATPALDRLRRLVHAFVRSECEEAEMRGALADAAPLYRDVPEAIDIRASDDQAMAAFLREALPDAGDTQLRQAAQLIKVTLREVARQFSMQPRSDAEITGQSDAMADMFCAYLRSLGAR